MMKLHKDDAGNVWFADLERVSKVISHFSYVSALAENVRLVRTKDHWLQYIGLMEANAGIQIPKRKIEVKKRVIFEREAARLERLYSGDWHDVYRYLIQIRIEADRKYAGVKSVFNSASSINRANIAAAEHMIRLSKGVRDTSIVGLSIISAVGTGGLTVALAYSGAASLSSVATYQDTGSVGKAALSGTLALVPYGGGKVTSALKTAGRSKTVLVSVGALIDFSSETVSQTLIKDADIRTAIEKATRKATTGVLSGELSAALVKKIGPRLRDAYRITDTHGGHAASNRLAPLLAKGSAKIAEDAGVAVLTGKKKKPVDRAAFRPTYRDPIADKAIEDIHKSVMRPATYDFIQYENRTYV